MIDYIPNRSCTTAGYIRGYMNALENGLARIKYYEKSDDIRFLNESSDWLEVAQIYLKEIQNAQTCEVEYGTDCS